MARHEIRGGALPLTLNANITSVSTTCQANGVTTGFPTGAVYPFVVTIDSERILCSSVAGSSPATITFATRGYDGTTATSHTANAEIVHGLAGVEIDDMMDHVYDETRDDHGQYLTEDRHATIAHDSGMYGAGSVDNTALATNSVDDRVLAPDSVGNSELKVDAVITENIGDAQVTNPKIADGAIDEDHLQSFIVTHGKLGLLAVQTDILADGAVTPVKQAAALPRGYIGRGERTTMLTALNATDHVITGCTVTFTAEANRRYKVTGHVRIDAGASATNVTASIFDNLTQLCRIGDFAAITDVANCHGDYDWVPGAGSHTVAVHVGFSAGTGNAAGGSSSSDPAFIRVEDIGGT